TVHSPGTGSIFPRRCERRRMSLLLVVRKLSGNLGLSRFQGCERLRVLVLEASVRSASCGEPGARVVGTKAKVGSPCFPRPRSITAFSRRGPRAVVPSRATPTLLNSVANGGRPSSPHSRRGAVPGLFDSRLMSTVDWLICPDAV